MSQPDDTRLRAFDDARKMISVSRAKQILRWQNWRHGGVLGGARVRPVQISPMQKTTQFGDSG